MPRKSQIQHIYEAIVKLKRCTCGDISQEVRLTRQEVEDRIWKLVKQGKIKVLDTVISTATGHVCNRYALIHKDEVKVQQQELF